MREVKIQLSRSALPRLEELAEQRALLGEPVSRAMVRTWLQIAALSHEVGENDAARNHADLARSACLTLVSGEAYEVWHEDDEVVDPPAATPRSDA